MYKLNYARVIDEAVEMAVWNFKRSEDLIDAGLRAQEVIWETVKEYNPIGLTKEDESWFINVLGLIDFRAGTMLSSKSDEDNKVGKLLLEIKTRFIIPKAENYKKMH